MIILVKRNLNYQLYTAYAIKSSFKNSTIIHEYTILLCIYYTIAIIEWTLSTHKKAKVKQSYVLHSSSLVHLVYTMSLFHFSFMVGLLSGCFITHGYMDNGIFPINKASYLHVSRLFLTGF